LYGLSCLDGFAQDVEVLDLAARLDLTVAEVPVHWTAMSGSKVRLSLDPAAMLRDLALLRLRRLTIELPVLTLPPGRHHDETVRRALRGNDIVLTDARGTHVLLAGVADPDLPDVVARVHRATGALPTRTRWTVMQLIGWERDHRLLAEL
jgi:hypothetical protein